MVIYVFLLMACKINGKPCGETMSGRSKLAKKVINSFDIIMKWSEAGNIVALSIKHNAFKCKIM